jgi:hypothetical protein
MYVPVYNKIPHMVSESSTHSRGIDYGKYVSQIFHKTWWYLRVNSNYYNHIHTFPLQSPSTTDSMDSSYHTLLVQTIVKYMPNFSKTW